MSSFKRSPGRHRSAGMMRSGPSGRSLRTVKGLLEFQYKVREFSRLLNSLLLKALSRVSWVDLGSDILELFS